VVIVERFEFNVAMKRTIECLASLIADAGVPDEFVYIPEGKHRIFPKSNPDGVWVNMPADRGEIIAAAFNKDLEQRQKQNVKPWIDFEHANKGPSAGEPTGFRYEKGKGLMCSASWSSAGRAAIEGRDFRYFSGRFDLEGDLPCGLPERGPLGGLVNEPAFREIPAITASEAEEITDPTIAMDKILILASCGILSDTEAALPNAEALARTRITAMQSESDMRKQKIDQLECELADLKKQHAAVTAECAAGKELRVKSIVEAAVAAGKIAPKDEDTKQELKELIEANEALGLKTIERLPVLAGANVTQTIVNKSGDRTVTAADRSDLEGFDLLEASLAEDAKA
jgi:phage I-like protein